MQDSIQREIDKVDRRKLAQAAAQLSEHYKKADFSTPAVATEAHRAAYLAVRLPATYAALRRVFAEIKLRAPQAEISSLLDLGAGPGTALFAAAEQFPHLRQATLIEADASWIALGKRLAEQSELFAVQHAQWLKQDLRSGLACEKHDLVVISYTLRRIAASRGRSACSIKRGNVPANFLYSLSRERDAVLPPSTLRGRL